MLNNKKFASGLICVGIAAIIAAIAVSVIFAKNYSTDIPAPLEEAVALSTFTRQGVSVSDIVIDGETRHYAALPDSSYLSGGECMGEAHEILGYSHKGKNVEVYALCGYNCYGFRDGMLVDDSGADNVPILLTFEKVSDGETSQYIFKSAKEALDGGEFTESVKEIFPAALARKALSASGDEAINQSREEQCRRYAEAYLVSIGREAKISSYHDESFKILSDFGVSVDVSNALYELHPEYSIYVGSFETLESGVRYVYSTVWDGDSDGTGTVTYTKKEYDSGKVVKTYKYSVDGDSFKQVKPKKKK